MAEDRAHSKYGGSSASRWMACPGSVVLCEQAPPPPTSSFARRGTVAHNVAERYLPLRVAGSEASPRQDIGKDFFEDGEKITFLKEDAEAVEVYLDAVAAEYAEDPGSQLFIEQRFVLDVAPALQGEVFGRNDAMIYSPAREKLVVFDYKHGAGVAVKAENNAQALFYATGALMGRDDWRVSTVEVVIVQPRSFDAAQDHGGVKRWSFDLMTVMEFYDTLASAIHRCVEAERAHQTVASGDLANWGQVWLAPGDHCRWCAAALTCPAIEQRALKEAGLAFSSVVEATPSALPEPARLDVERMAGILRAADVLEGWFDQVRRRAFEEAQAGRDIPGFKLVEKQARRKWTDDEHSIAGYLASSYGVDVNDLMPPKLVTITEAEKLLASALGGAKNAKAAKDDVSLKFTIKESSGLTLVAASDKRDAVVPAAAFATVSVPAT
jgi:hypothetical protein